MSEVRRNIQFLRNDVALVASHEVAREKMAAAFAKMTDVKDGEIFLYRYSILGGDNTVFTSIAAVYIDENNNDEFTGTKRIEVLGNYSELSEAINAVDTKVGGLSNTANSHGAKILANETAINEVKGRMDIAEGKITAVEGKMTTAKSAIEAAEGKITAAEGKITAAEGKINTNEGAITSLQTAITGMTLTASDVVVMNEAGTALQASKISETDGKVTVAAAETIVEFNKAINSDNKVATMADITDAAYTAGKGITITDKAIAADLTLSYNEETKMITLVGANGGNYGGFDASVFIKDGILDNATYYPETNKLSLTFNTDAEKQTIEVDLGDLVDTYTADNTYLTVADNQFSHKTVNGLDSKNTHGLTDNVTVNSTTPTSFNVPSLKVDAAGHVVSVDEKQVTISLPASIGTAIQNGAGVNTTYIQTTVARNATNTNQLDVTATAVIGDYAAQGQVDGLATTSATKTYIDNAIANTPKENTVTTLKTENLQGITVTDTATDGNHNYTVGLNIDSNSMLSINKSGALTVSNVVDCGKYAE